MIKEINFNECPRPQLVRNSWKSLNGQWDFCFDFENRIWPRVKPFVKEYEITVPFSYLTKASGINIQERCDCLWYRKNIQISKKKNSRYIIHFEGVDYCLRLIVNNKFVSEDTGAYHRMSFDITDFVIDGNNEILVNTLDDNSVFKPRGKQRWTKESFECWYKETTGIYKEVWIEEVNKTFIENVKITPFVDTKTIEFDFSLVGDLKNYYLEISLMDGEKEISKSTFSKLSNDYNCKIEIKNKLKLWSVENPELYDIVFRLYKNNSLLDECFSYCGFRKIEVENGQVFLNSKPIYQKLVLDQGYWKDSELTPPSNKALYDDIKTMMDFGFNGCRKHEKFEDERFIYYCDVLGFLLWCEMPSMLDNNPTSRLIFEREWSLEMKQVFNHPSIIVWTVFNESWGINHVKDNKEVQDFVDKMYALTKKIDPSRLVITNDGWEHTISDLITMHHYEQNGEKLYSYFNKIDKCVNGIYESHARGAFADGYFYNGQPLLLSEFGGTALADANSTNWGYGKAVLSKEELAERLESLFTAIQKIPFIVGYCYTQVSDVQQEINGLLTEDRKPKFDPKILKKIQDKRN